MMLNTARVGPVLGGVHILVLLTSMAVWTSCALTPKQFQDDDRLIGWQGNTYKQNDQAARAGREPWIETITWKPRAFIYHGFLSHHECDTLKREALSRLERSMVVGDNGTDAVDPIRTSYSASLSFHESPIVMLIEDRIAAWTHLPLSHGEPIEVLRYKNDQKYEAHWDWFGDDQDVDKEPGGDRVATVLMYLSDVDDDAGGETSLPLAEPLDPELQDIRSMSLCASRMGVAIKPRKGDSLLFWDALPDANVPDRRSLHSSCPTSKGEKWTATKWIHVRPYLDDDTVRDGLQRKQQLAGAGSLTLT